MILPCLSIDVTAAQHAISEGLNSQLSAASSGGAAGGAEDGAVLARLRETAGNDACADCGAPGPDWASINQGVVLCLDCSGVHRRLGTHLTKVRSAVLDVREWTPALLALFDALSAPARGGSAAFAFLSVSL